MSNQKPARYQPTYMPGPAPQRDAFHVAQQTYVPQQNQTGNQGQGLRGMAPTGPPTQASTPPNNDLKVQQQQIQPSMNLTYMAQQPVRNAGQNYFRGPPPQSQNPRMPNHRQGQQPMYQQQSTQFVQVPSLQPVFCTAPMFYPNGAQRGGPVPVPQYYPSGQTFATLGYPQTAQNAAQSYINYAPFLRPGTQPQLATASQNLTQAQPPALPLTQSTQQHQARTKKRRDYAIPIIDPDTGKDKLCEMYDQDDSHPASGESSARQTPQPANTYSKEVQNAFTKQVNMVISQDKPEEVDHSPASVLDHHLDSQSVYHNLSQAVHTNTSDLVKSSTLLVPSKDFVPAIQSTTAKEITPVVSAITDAAEVTINMKDRESPIKNRKREHVIKENKDVVKEVAQEKSIKEEYKIIKDEHKPKEVIPTPIVPSKEVKEISNQREEKKTQKKEKNDQPKAVTNSSTPDVVVVPENIPVPNVLPVLVQDNAKPKKPKEVAKQVHQQPVPVPPKSSVPVPQSQPTKANNKASKMRELNMKGASKQGTDMDAFSDNIASFDTVNANTTNSSNVPANDININASDINDSNKKIESNEIPTIKPEFKQLPEFKPLPKGKIDITDIVKDVPKPFIAPVESHDETDRVELTNEKIVRAKNEANTKSNIENDSSVIDTKPTLPYKDDQWSPFNKSGKRIYDKEFLMLLRNDPKSKKKPDNLLETVAQEDRGRVGDINRYPMGGRTTDFTPAFGGSSFSGKSSSQRGAPPKRNSQQGKVSGGGSKSSKTNNRLSFSVREDVKLHETENAWKPARYNVSGNMTDEEKKTQELYRKVRGVLNKLTPQKFETLISQVRALPIDNAERLQGVIDLVFEKAVDEPNFSVAYALMCRELALMQVPANNKKEEFVNFRKLLITRCQLEFEKNSVDEITRNGRMKEIEECTDPEKKKELQVSLEEEDRRIRRKSVGNIRFIGELFKQQMLTVNIMLRCLNNLLADKDEESLECLCKLLTTVGKEVETVKKTDLLPIFGEMKDIVDRKHGKISSRVRFMLQDVIDLRNAKWVPRRQDLNPKTMDQIQKEAHDEQLNIQVMNSGPPPRKDDRSGSGQGLDRKQRRNNVSDNDGWSTAPTRGSRTTAFTVQSDKLKTKTPQIDEPLGSVLMFGRWGSGSNIKTSAPAAAPPNTANMFAALENIGNETDKRTMLGSRSKEPYSSKGPSLERGYKQSYEDDKGSRSGSQHRSHDNSQRSTPTPVHPQSLSKSNPPVSSKPPSASEEMSPKQLELKLKNILEEYLNDCCTIAECDEDIKGSIPSSALSQLVAESYINVLERSKTARLRTGRLFGQLIILKTLPLDDYCAGLEEVLSQADDLTIDIPKIWDYLAEIVAPVLWENALPMNKLLMSCNILISQGHSSKLLAPMFKLVIADKGPNYLLSIWESSEVSLSDFMPAEQVNDFVKEHMFEFLMGGSSSSVGQSDLTYEQIHDKLLQLFTNKNSFDDICKWITANIGDKVNEKQFIRTLATCVFEDSIVNSKLKTEILKNHYTLFTRFVDSNSEYELQCLFALQALINKLEHPQGILLSICNSLYEDNIFSHDSFVAWESSGDPAEQEGKGVALKQLTSFFTQLKEADEESSSASEDA